MTTQSRAVLQRILQRRTNWAPASESFGCPRCHVEYVIVPPNTAGLDPHVRELRSGVSADGSRRMAALRARRRLISREVHLSPTGVADETNGRD